MKDAILEGKDLVSGYNDKPVVDDVSIKVGEGEKVSIIGPNGSGKSTLLKTLVGVLEPSSGSVFFRKENVTDLAVHKRIKRGIGYVPQERNVFPSLTVREHLEIGLQDGQEKAPQEIYDLFPPLKNKEDRKARDLSGGQKKMVAVSRALVQEPNILLVDEPTAGLAPELQKNLYESLNRVNEKGIAVLLVEQRVESALKHTERTYVMRRGNVVREGTAEKMQKEDISEIFLS